MKNCLKAALLFGALFLTGCEATAQDEHKTTEATAWVDGWTKQMETVAESIGTKDMCDGGGVQVLLNSFIEKSHETFAKYLSLGDMIRLSSAENFIFTVVVKTRSCLVLQQDDLNHKLDKLSAHK